MKKSPGADAGDIKMPPAPVRGRGGRNIFCRLSLFELRVVQLGIEAVLRKQLFVAALFDDVAVLHDEDEVGVADGRKAVRDDKGGAPHRQLIHRLLNELLRAGIDGGSRLVQDEHGRVFDHRAGDGDELLLPRGEVRLVVEHGVVAVRKGADEMIQPHRLAGADDLLVGHVLLAVYHVFADGAVEQPGILQNHAEQVVYAFAGEFARGDAVDPDAPAVYLVEAHQQVDHGRLAGARRPDDGDPPSPRRKSRG